MSKYYGQVKGSADTVASRRGTEKSGIRVSAQSWDGSVIVCMHNDRVDIEMSQDSSMHGTTMFSGTLEELTRVFNDLHSRE